MATGGGLQLRPGAGLTPSTLSLTFVYRFGGYKEKEWEEPDTSRFGM